MSTGGAPRQVAEATGCAASFFCCFFVVFVAGAHKAGVVGTAAVWAARCAQSSRVEFVVDMTGLSCLELVWWGKGKKAQLRMVLCDGGTNPFMTNHYMFTRGSSKPLVVATRTALSERLEGKSPR